MLHRKISLIAVYISLFTVGLMWAVFALDYLLDLELFRYGLFPRKAEGLIGILTMPFIHSTHDMGHIVNNSIPTFALFWLTFYHYREIATKSLVIIWLLTGLGTWFAAGNGYHIGMSGVIYGLTSFLVFSGFFRKNVRVAAISLVVIFLYGSMVWGIFPIRENMSWEGHLMGLFSGIIAAVIFIKSPPQAQKMGYEIEEELGIEPEHEYWKDQQYRPQQQSKIIINYEIVPRNVHIENEPVDDEEE